MRIPGIVVALLAGLLLVSWHLWRPSGRVVSGQRSAAPLADEPGWTATALPALPAAWPSAARDAGVPAEAPPTRLAGPSWLPEARWPVEPDALRRQLRAQILEPTRACLRAASGPLPARDIELIIRLRGRADDTAQVISAGGRLVTDGPPPMALRALRDCARESAHALAVPLDHGLAVLVRYVLRPVAGQLQVEQTALAIETEPLGPGCSGAARLDVPRASALAAIDGATLMVADGGWALTLGASDDDCSLDLGDGPSLHIVARCGAPRVGAYEIVADTSGACVASELGVLVMGAVELDEDIVGGELVARRAESDCLEARFTLRFANGTSGRGTAETAGCMR